MLCYTVVSGATEQEAGMRNEAQLAILRQGVTVWHKQQKTNPNVYLQLIIGNTTHQNPQEILDLTSLICYAHALSVKSY